MNKLLILFFFIFFFSQKIYADVKVEIIKNLENTKTLKFNFTQSTNGKEEIGKCIMLFPGSLKCTYQDDKLKELVIRKDKLIITQKRYNKTYMYPVSGSLFLKILDKKELIKIIKTSSLKTNTNLIKLFYQINESENITVLFNKNNYDLMGWITQDRFNNEVVFLIEVYSKNEKISEKEFKPYTIN